MRVRMIVVVDGEQAIAVGMIAEGAETDLKGMWRKRGRGMARILLLIVIAMAWSWGLELFWSALFTLALFWLGFLFFVTTTTESVRGWWLPRRR